MPITLDDLFGPSELEDALARGYVRVAQHPTEDLHILNYSDTTQYERAWGPVTRACRGLVVDGDGLVHARPWPKFFNVGEPEADLGTGPVEVADKIDGSLGILYRATDGPALATRGSFVSDQARHGTEVLRTRYRRFDPNPAWTYLFEIVYPDNRIVVDYAGLDDLVLLGAVDVATGRSVPFAEVAGHWMGPVVERFDYPDLTRALSAPARPNREGLVVHFVDKDVRVKVKYEEYLRLHRIVTGLSTKTVFEHLKSGRDLAELLAEVPDELYAAVAAVAGPLEKGYAELVASVESHYEAVRAQFDPAVDRGAFARAVLALDFPLRHALFELADHSTFDRDKVWDRLRPTFRLLRPTDT